MAPFDEYSDFTGGIATSSMYQVYSYAVIDPIFDPKIRRELLDDLFKLLNRKRPIRAATIGSRIIRRDLIFRPPDDVSSRYGSRPASVLTNTNAGRFCFLMRMLPHRRKIGPRKPSVSDASGDIGGESGPVQTGWRGLMVRFHNPHLR